MAPPIPGLRKPVPVPHRTAGDVLIGLLAVVALAALTVGVPIALISVIGLPWPHAAPGLSVFTHQLDVPSILVTPMLAAVFTTLHRPTFCSSSA